MQPNFSFAVDARRSLIRVEMAGFFEPPDIARFRAGLERALATLDAPRNQHCMVVDVRGMKVQSQDRVADFQAIFAEPAYRSRRLAIVAGSSLSRTQVKRAAAGRDAVYFERPGDADAWLSEASDPPVRSCPATVAGARVVPAPAARWFPVPKTMVEVRPPAERS